MRPRWLDHLRAGGKLQRHPANPILTPSPDRAWERAGVLNCAVVHDGTRFRMLYRALDRPYQEPFVSRLGLATSADGVHFDRRPEPIFSPQEPWESRGCEDPRLVAIEGRYVLTYVGYNGSQARIGLSTSEDLLHWTPHRLAQPRESKNPALFPARLHGHYVLYHRVTQLFRPHAPEIWLAYSRDLETWEEGGPVLAPRPGAWDEARVGIGAPPIPVPEGWFVLYHGADRQNVYRLGYFITAPDDPTRILERSDHFVLEPQTPYEREGLVPNVVFTCGAAVVGDRLWVYYGGGDRVIALGTSP